MTNQLTEELVYWEFADPPEGVDDAGEMTRSSDPDPGPNGHEELREPTPD